MSMKVPIARRFVTAPTARLRGDAGSTEIDINPVTGTVLGDTAVRDGVVSVAAGGTVQAASTNRGTAARPIEKSTLNRLRDIFTVSAPLFLAHEF